MLRRPGLVALALLALSHSPAVSIAQAVSPGRAALEKMNAAYRGKWYKTLTFVQKTTTFPDSAAPRVQTWWESLRYTPERGVQLRIDRGDLTIGSGSLQTADSTWIVRNGALAQVRPDGNEFLPLIEGVYVQPLNRTEREVSAIGVDLSKAVKRTWEGRPTTVVGSASLTDTTSSQFWVDDERQVVVRMIVSQRTGGALDVILGGYERLAGGWLATKVDIYIGGKLRQREEYSEWKADIALTDALFDPAQWAVAPHWGKKR